MSARCWPAKCESRQRPARRRPDDAGHPRERPVAQGGGLPDTDCRRITTARPIRLSDVANVQDSVENIRAAGYLNGKPAIPLIILRQPGANIIDTVDRVKAELPSLKASIPAGIKLDVVLDRTTTIRASVREIERTLLIAIALVILVVFIFLRSPRATLIPAVVVPVSLIATFGVMYLFGYSVDNLSLMALTISTGFVVDDAIVVIENVTRHLEMGLQTDAGGAERRAAKSASPCCPSAFRWWWCSSRFC